MISINFKSSSPKDAVDKLGDKSVSLLRDELVGVDTNNGEQLLLATRRLELVQKNNKKNQSVF
jgi:hypothetical protein